MKERRATTGQRDVHERVRSVLRCPHTGGRLVLSPSRDHLVAEGSSHAYPIVDGIVDFLSAPCGKVQRAYDSSSWSYDFFITCANPAARLYNAIIWGSFDHGLYARATLDLVPDAFAGVLVDVPIGTGVFTAEKYARLRDAAVIGVDYSWNMLQKARQRLSEEGIDNVVLVRADVAHLPLVDSSVDLVLSMNGLHAFPRKEEAVREAGRILRAGGRFAACTYVHGRHKFTDAVMKYYYGPVGWFSRPFLSEEEVSGMLAASFDCLSRRLYRSMLVLDARKRES